MSRFCASARVWPLPGGLLPSQQEVEYSFSGFIPTHKQTNKQVNYKKENPNHLRVHCGSAFEPGASGLLYYCTSICARSCCTWRARCVDPKRKKPKRKINEIELKTTFMCPYKKTKSKVNCKSAFEPGASGLLYYCTSICVHSCCNWHASCVDSKPKKQKKIELSTNTSLQNNIHVSKVICRSAIRFG